VLRYYCVAKLSEMKQKLSRIIVLLFFIALAGAAVYTWLNQINRLLYKAIPQGAMVIAEVRDVGTTLEKIAQANYWRDMQFVDAVGKLERSIFLLDTLLLPADSLSPQRIIASLHRVKEDDYDYLLLADHRILKADLDSLMRNMQKKGFTVAKRQFRSAKIYEIDLPMLQQSFTVATDGAILLAGSNPVVVDEAISQFHALQSNGFWRHTWLDDDNSDIRLYLNTQNFPLLNDMFLRNSESQNTLFNQFADICTWVKLSVQFDKTTVRFNGTATWNNNQSFLADALNRKPAEQTRKIAEVVPFDVAFLASGSDRNLYRFLSSRNESDMSNDALTWVGNEWGYGFGEPNGADPLNEAFIMLQVNDKKGAATALEAMRRVVADSTLQTIDYRGGQLKPANLESYAQLFMSKQSAERFQTAYYAFVGDFAIFAPQVAYLKVFIDKAIAQKNLAQQPEYRRSAQLFDPNANIHLYLQPDRMRQLLQGAGTDSFNEYLSAKFGYFRHLSPVAIQLKGKGSASNISGEIAYTQKTDEKMNALWSAQLLGVPIGKPHAVHISGTQAKQIMMQDRQYNLYMIDNEGRIVWKRNIGKPILGNVFATDYYRNGNYYYLFNTAQEIFLIDRDGENVLDYPIRLSTPASTGLTPIDFNNDRNYQIFVPSGNKVYGYEFSGRPLATWNPKLGLGTLKYPLLYVQHKGKSYIVATSENGTLRITDPNGGIIAKADLKATLIAEPQIELRNGTPQIVVTTQKGTTYTVNLNGTYSSKTLMKPSSKSDFMSHNVIGSEDAENVFMANNKVYVFDRYNKLYERKFATNEYPSSIFPIKLNGQKNNGIGVFCDNAQKAYLLNGDCVSYPSFPLTATTPFIVCDLFGNGENILIAGGIGNSVFAYKLQ
jgi:hypothetical protein